VLPGRAKSAPRVRQKCPQGAPELPGCAKSAPRVRQKCSQGAPEVFPGCAKSAPTVRQECSRLSGWSIRAAGTPSAVERSFSVAQTTSTYIWSGTMALSASLCGANHERFMVYIGRIRLVRGVRPAGRHLLSCARGGAGRVLGCWCGSVCRRCGVHVRPNASGRAVHHSDDHAVGRHGHFFATNRDLLQNIEI